VKRILSHNRHLAEELRLHVQASACGADNGGGCSPDPLSHADRCLGYARKTQATSAAGQACIDAATRDEAHAGSLLYRRAHAAAASPPPSILPTQLKHNSASKPYPMSLDGSRSGQSWDTVTIIILILILIVPPGV
jgi:hypothetical protein